MEGGTSILTLLVCIALTKPSFGVFGEEMFKREHSPVGFKVGISDDEIFKTLLKKILQYANSGDYKILFQMNVQGVSRTCRVRKEFLTGLTKEEKAHFVNTVKTAASTEPYKTRYENLLTIHKRLFYRGIHTQKYFLPWHRWFLVEYENILREIDSDITVPYWDWSLVANEIFDNDFWATDESGFGEDGDPAKSSCVQTGPFRRGEFSLIQSAGGGCLTRNFNGRVQDAVQVQRLLSYSAKEFFYFEEQLRVDFHDNFHCCIEGTMCSTDAASAPEFFEHHGFIDKIWSDWQEKGNDYQFSSLFMGIDAKMLATAYLPRDYLDLKHMPGGVCVKYEDPRRVVFENLKGLSFEELKNIPSQPLPEIARKAMELFNVPRSVVVRVSNLRERFQPNRVVQNSKLKGLDGVFGFELSAVEKVKATKTRLESDMVESSSDSSEITQ
ncbi:uncharacterized protein LOC114534193 [Dendronephthya gigantea]|uniref:uncharacterized protein LOC114534193 n=1 Tax=Dendronephthya gigantea TaxID=151771 RepID=UPI001068F286|nr:uncharacterized protein LOC114534193 [Dendronephthya gigantea]